MRNVTAKEIEIFGLPMMKSNFFNKVAQKLLHLMNYINKLLNPIVFKVFKMGKPKTSVVRLKEYLMPTGDGALMSTDIYLPKKVYEKKEKAPTIFVRLPYWKNAFSIFGYAIASLGYAVVLQDIRGCAKSMPHGTNSFFMTEAHDGFTAVHWLTKRFWYNGKIGMWGPSYLGMTQLALSFGTGKTPDIGDAINCLVPTFITYSSLLHHEAGLTMLGNSTAVYGVLLAITRSSRLVLDNSEMDFDKITEKLYRSPKLTFYNEPLNHDRYDLDMSKISRMEIPERVRIVNEKFNLNLDITKKDEGAFFKLLDIIFYHRKIKMDQEVLPVTPPFDFTKLKKPILMVAGWYDLFSDLLIKDFQKIMELAPEESKKNIKVIMGPWAHVFNGHPDDLADVGGLLGIIPEIIPQWWYNHWLRDEKSDKINDPPLRIFVMGKRTWRNLNEWPPKKSKPVKFYLHSNGKANSRFGDGVISQKEPNNEASDKFIFNPINPVVTKGGDNLTLINGAHDQLKTEERDDVLVYTSEPLKEGIEVTGDIQLVLHASSTAKDTDFMAKLVDVYPKEKKAINIKDNGIRTRYRDYDLENPKFIEPGKIVKYTIKLGSVSIYFNKGHRIRLEVTSSNFPKYNVHSNLTGEKNAKGYQKATQEIFHDSKNPSYLILPIYPSKK